MYFANKFTSKMRITDYGYLDIRIYNPITEEEIINFMSPNYEAESLSGIWFLDNPENPFLKNKELEEEWDTFMKDHKESFEVGPLSFFAIEEFLLTYNDESLQTIRHSSSAIGHGMGGTVAWYVVDSYIEVEEADLERMNSDDARIN
jgi:hypothetical protein